MTPRATRRAKARDALGRPPAILVIAAAVAALFIAAPLVALVASTPWGRFVEEVSRPEVRQALWLSLLTSGLAVLLCLLVGLPLAWVLARLTFPGRRALRALVTVPLVLPPVVCGVALLAAFGRNGLLGGPLRDLTGVTLPFTTTAVVLAHTFVALPFFVISVEGALRSADQRYDVAAATLGAGRWLIFRRVTLPMALPGVAAGCVLAWARSLGEFGATITFAGNFPGTTQTLPLLVYTQLQADVETARVLSLIMLAVSVAILVLLRERWLGGFR